jgi:hypothetical protein
VLLGDGRLEAKVETGIGPQPGSKAATEAMALIFDGPHLFPGAMRALRDDPHRQVVFVRRRLFW